jgi:hypothetical protein
MRIDGRFIRVAEELLITQEPRWTSTEARGVVVRAFQSGGIEADASEVRACASSTFRVGCAIEQLDELAHLNPWPIETLQSEIDLRIAPWLSAELRKPFVDTLAAQVKNKEPFRPRLLDWTPEINRFLRLTSTPDFFPDLMAKIDLAQRLFQLIEERRDVLVRSVEQDLKPTAKRSRKRFVRTCSVDCAGGSPTLSMCGAIRLLHRNEAKLPSRTIRGGVEPKKRNS